MKILKHQNLSIAYIDRETSIKTTRDILDIMATASYYEDSVNIALLIHEESLGSEFFDLSTCLAGDILQKLSNYSMKVAIVGDYSKYTSKALADFIRECNRGSLIFFVDSIDSGIAALERWF